MLSEETQLRLAEIDAMIQSRRLSINVQRQKIALLENEKRDLLGFTSMVWPAEKNGHTTRFGI